MKLLQKDNAQSDMVGPKHRLPLKKLTYVTKHTVITNAYERQRCVTNVVITVYKLPRIMSEYHLGLFVITISIG